LREQQPIHEIAKRYQIHPSQVTEWKKALLGNASTGVLTSHGIKISMDGKGRALDNVMIELYQGLSAFFRKCNTRKHQSLGMSPEQNYQSGFKMEDAA